jgi:predicted nucleic acid-binding protein
LYFFESSALMKLFVFEKGSPAMVRLVERAEDREKTISALAVVEVRSAIRRRERAGELSPAHAASAVTSLNEELRRLIEHPMTSAVTARASVVIDKYALRALDALQLGTAIVVDENSPSGERVTFICSDSRLLSAAEQEGFATWNPETA